MNITIWTKKKAVAIATAFLRVSDKIRTRDLLVRSQTLYPAELPAHNYISVFIATKHYNSFIADAIHIRQLALPNIA